MNHDNARVVELRIHGVSGTPPEEMLDHALVRQVAGDQDGRFYRPVDAAGHELRAADGHVLEGYHWGPMTSGSWRQALWLVLIPFGLVNAAYFMLPKPVDGKGTWPRRIARGALRALGIVLTAVLVLSIAEAVIDLFAWQWTGITGGDPRYWLLGGFAVTALAVLAIPLLSGRGQETYDPPAPSDATPLTDLVDGEFHTGDRKVPALHRLHLAAGFAVLGVLATSTIVKYRDGSFDTALCRVSVGVLVLVVVHAAVLGASKAHLVVARIECWLTATASTLSIALLFFGGGLPTGGDRGLLPGIADASLWSAVAVIVILVVLIVSTGALAWRTGPDESPKEFRRFLHGMAGPTIAALGVFLGVGFAAALDYGLLRVLRPSGQPNAIVLPLFEVRVAYAVGLAVGLAVVVALVGCLGCWVRYKKLKSEVEASDRGLGEAQVPAVTRAWWVARIKFSIQLPVLVFALAGLVLTFCATYEEIAADGAAATLTTCPTDGGVLPAWLDWLSSCTDRPGLDPVTVGTVTLLALGAGLVYLGRTSLTDSTVRRAAAVVWDLVAFWPRAAHPLVPPPYSPKVIDDLTRRIAWHLDEHSKCRASRVILAGHSQGSLIAVAAVTRLSDDHRKNVALLTFGSQLQIAYSKAFPAYVNFGYLYWLWDEAVRGRWVSLFRKTDPIGGPVLTWECGTEQWLSDPVWADGETRPQFGMRKHSGYTLDPRWPEAVGKLKPQAGILKEDVLPRIR